MIIFTFNSINIVIHKKMLCIENVQLKKKKNNYKTYIMLHGKIYICDNR